MSDVNYRRQWAEGEIEAGTLHGKDMDFSTKCHVAQPADQEPKP